MPIEKIRKNCKTCKMSSLFTNKVPTGQSIDGYGSMVVENHLYCTNCGHKDTK